MKHLNYFIAAIALFFAACQSKQQKFEVSGNITSAENKIVYFEHRALPGIEVLDSAKLNDKGEFKFKAPAPENPEFYQLRIDNKTAVFTVNSTEKLTVSADFKDLFGTFTVKDSPVNQQIKDVIVRRHQVATQIIAMGKAHAKGTLSDEQYLLTIDSLLTDYKEFATKIILGNPSSAAAYYAVFQKIDNYLIFNPYDKKDFGVFGAVATSWNTHYPETARSKHVYDFSMNALKQRKQSEKNTELMHNLQENAAQVSLNDIVLPDLNGKNRSLQSLKGNVVLLDFTAYSAKYSPDHNIRLNEVYQQLKNRGLQIYQVSFDSDEHFWKNTAANLPWISVRDPQSVDSDLLRTYNIRELPSTFVLDRNGDIVSRVSDYSKLSAELNKVL